MKIRPIPKWSWLLLILLFAFITRLYRVEYPSTYVFDEVYHAVTAKLVARNDARAYEWSHPAPEPNTAIDWLHPPVAKYTQALSMLVFGETSFGWRFSSVVFGVGVIAAVYVLAQLAFQKQPLSLMAAAVASLDGLLLVQSRIAMNDIHVTFFILLTLILYLLYKQRQDYVYLLLTGIAGGLAMGSKWSGVFVVATLGFVEGIQILKAWHVKKYLKETKDRTTMAIISFLIIPPLMYILAYSHMFLQGKSLDHFYQLHEQIWAYQTNLTATHPYQSRPLQWFLDVRPVWYYVDHGEQTISNIYAFGNPLVLWLGAAAAIVSYLYLLRNRLNNTLTEKDMNLFLILFAYGMTWLPWLLSPRIMFFYHYTPAVPLLCILVGYWLHKIWHLPTRDKNNWHHVIVGSVLALTFLVFIVWYPNWTALPVPQEFADKTYFMFTSWK